MVFEKLGRYEILEELGNGGFGTVFKARDKDLDRPVAIKILHPHLVNQSGFIERFYQEARAAAKLEHPYIVPIHEVGEAEGRHFIVMRYLEGRGLDNQLKQRHGPLSMEHTLVILEDVASALDYAHRRGIVHRDVKPSNIFITSTGAVLTDFGIVRVLNDASRVTATGQALGTPEYMAPEQIKGEDVSPQTDIYALGIVAYEMLTGKVPFTGNTPFAIQEGHVHRTFTPLYEINPKIPAAINRVFERVLAKRPSNRYAQANDFVKALKQTQVHSAPSSSVEKTVPTPRPAIPPAVSPDEKGEAQQLRQTPPTPSNSQPANSLLQQPHKSIEQQREGSMEKKRRSALVMGVIGTIIGLLGACLGTFWFVAALLSVPGLSLGIWGLIKTRQTQKATAARVWAIIAVVVNAIALLITCVIGGISFYLSS